MDWELLRYRLLSDTASAPFRASDRAIGYDLASAYDYVLPAKGKCLCETDLQIAIPEGCYGRIAPRSGLALRRMIDVGAGVIDPDYRGNVGVLLFNFGTDDYKIRVGDRIAQLILECAKTPETKRVDNLVATARGGKGFGSSDC